ncbi:MAG TPA: cation-translocating P-type ATPase [Patescibacteria group bacterium]|nr:cation-translocating P-type ATPase [Patescibacteria group bacterium]
MPETIVASQAVPGPIPRRATTQLAIDGMTCGNCARHVTEALQGVLGVQTATVNLDGHQATVRWQSEVTPRAEDLLQAVQKEGFGAQIVDEQSGEQAAHQSSGWGLNLGIGIPVTAVLMLGEWALRLGLTPWFQWCSFGLAGLVQLFGGARFYRGAWLQLKAANSNMDTLVALGSTTAFAYSAWTLLSGHGGHLYFMEAAAIITLISAGHWIESRVSLRASSALRKLLDLAPALALRLNADGTQTEVPVSQVTQGEQIVLGPGDRVPTDGIVLEGTSAVDESMLTGESLPVDKKPGHELYTGTINLNGRLVGRVTATGEETALAHIVAAVQRAQSSRASIQRLGDRVSSVFVPIVVAIALTAALWWGLAPASATQLHDWLGRFLWHAPVAQSGLASALIIAAAVLIIACPCAMGLATPAAIMAGSNAAAQRGILIRDGIALEKAGRVHAVVFDKTGTLTFGKPGVTEVVCSAAVVKDQGAAPTNESALKQLAADLSRPSRHPISRAVAELAKAGAQLENWREVHGSGVQATITRDDGRRVEGRLGSLRWLSESGVDLSMADGFVRKWSDAGATTIGISVDGTLVGLIALQDTLKPGAAAVVKLLQGSGLKTFLITGDNVRTAATIARQAGIEPNNVFAEVRPEQKAELIKKLQQDGSRIAFVGDGINDAPALEQADLGIAVSKASDIAREAADIVLLKSEIEAIPESLGLARATLRTIKQNLFWAFFYNALGIPLAALGFMSPILCAAAMGLSDLVVIGNALRLLRWRL